MADSTHHWLLGHCQHLLHHLLCLLLHFVPLFFVSYLYVVWFRLRMTTFNNTNYVCIYVCIYYVCMYCIVLYCYRFMSAIHDKITAAAHVWVGRQWVMSYLFCVYDVIYTMDHKKSTTFFDHNSHVVWFIFLQRGRIACNAERCYTYSNSVCLSVCLSVCPSVCHTLVPYPDEWR